MPSEKPAPCTFYFKLFNNLKAESEIFLARRELNSLFGPVEDVSNFIDEVLYGELAEAFPVEDAKGAPRFQDAITYELPYGKTQGFKGKGMPSLLPKLTKRLAYTREIYVLAPKFSRLSQHPSLIDGVNLFKSVAKNVKGVRTITNQYFLEKSEYVSKLSRNTSEIDANLETLLNFMEAQFYRIPATETMAIGKRLEDYFAIRQEPSLYLTHYLHPYKGKFHPKLARCLINCVCPQDEGTLLDNFSGSGTALVEAQWLGLNSIGVDINPLSVLMSQVKVESAKVEVRKLESAIGKFLGLLETEGLIEEKRSSGQSILHEIASTEGEYNTIISSLSERAKSGISDDQLKKILHARYVLHSLYGDSNGSAIHEFLLLGVSVAISDIARRTQRDFFVVLRERLPKLKNRVYLAEKLSKVLSVDLGDGRCLVGDTRDLSKLRTLGGKPATVLDDSVDCIVNSPPYSVAIDYIRNDLPQLTLLGLVGDMENLEDSLIGNPRRKPHDDDLQLSVLDEENVASIPYTGRTTLKKMVREGDGKRALGVIRFWSDMRKTLLEMNRVLKPGGKAAVVIGDNKINPDKDNQKFDVIPNIDVFQQLAQDIGFKTIEVIPRRLEKSMRGWIRDEAIIVLQKPESSIQAAKIA